MSKLNVLQKYIKSAKHDELYTPKEAIDILIPYIPDYVKTVWECTGIPDNNIEQQLINNSYRVISSSLANNENFFTYTPVYNDYDIIITNPPYSIKDAFLQRAFEIGKPFAFLLPLTGLEGKKRIAMYNNYVKPQLIIPNKRFNFMENAGKKGAWFQTSWFTFWWNLDADLNFVET